MTLWARFRSWLRATMRRSRMESEMDVELRFHMEAYAEDLMRGGVPRSEALRRARIEFGGIERAKEECREARSANFVESLLQDIRFGFRMLRKSPGSTAAVVVALALGIGLNTTMFSFVNALLLRPPTLVQSPEQLLELWLRAHGTSGIESVLPLTFPDYIYYRDHNQSFSGLLAFDGDPEAVIWNRSGEGEVVHGQLVSGNFFSVLGINTPLGRPLLDEDDRVGSPRPAIVLGRSFWQRRLGSDSGVVGTNMMLNGTNFTVVGVVPAGFAGLLIAVEPDFWASLTVVEQITRDTGRLTNRQGHWLLTVGRLRSSVTAATARAEMTVLSHQIETDHPDTNKDLNADVYAATLVPGPYRGYVAAFTGLLMAVFGLLMVIACVNAASLLLARATSRAREMAIRSALGAARGRLIRQLLVESLLLAGLAGCAGTALAYWMAPLLMTLKPASLPLTLRVPLDWRVLLFTFLASLVTGILFGLTPALRVARAQVAPLLKDESQSVGYRKSRLRNALMIAEIATCVLLLIGASLCVRSLANANSIDPGFDTQHIAIATLDPGSLGYSATKVRTFYAQLSEHIHALPGVSAVSFVNHLPLGPAREKTTIVESRQPSSEQKNHGVPADVFRVAPGFFDSMAIPLLQGGDFTQKDNEQATKVTIINEVLAHQLSPNENPVGRRITMGADAESTEIVGVVKAGKYRTLGEDPIPVAYVPNLPGRRTLVVRAAGDPSLLLAEIRREIHIVDPNLAATDLETMRQYMSLPLFAARTTAVLLGACGILALVMTCIGLFGVISYVVSQRTHEIGVRVALGAGRHDVLKLVLRQGLTVASIGLTLGLAAALVVTRFLSSLLYGIRPNDPATLAGVSLGITSMVLLACYIPARRAMRVDPMIALRYE